MLSTTNITMQFGAKPLFENVSVKFGEGNRYGLIGANGCGKSTFMKILGGDLEPSAGTVAIDRGERVGKLRQDQFAYEDMRVLDVVLMGHDEMWQAMQERDAIYANPDASEDDYMHAAELEDEFAEFGGYTAEARAGELLLGIGIPIEQHDGPMSAVAPGWKLRVLLAQALFGDPDILLLDEPTNNLDINTIRWLEDVLNARTSTMIIISHDRHFLSSVCTHMADVDYGEIRVYPGNYDDYMLASTQAREQLLAANAKAKEKDRRAAGFRAPLLGQRVEGAPGHFARAPDREDQARGHQALEPRSIRTSASRSTTAKSCTAYAVEVQKLAKGYDKPLIRNFNLAIEAGEKNRDHRPQRHRQDHAVALPGGRSDARRRNGEMDRKGAAGLLRAGPCRRIHRRGNACRLDRAAGKARTTTTRPCARRSGGCCSPATTRRNRSRVISGGEQQRMMFGKLILQKPNVLLMDEPTNHLDMESIESLNTRARQIQGHADFRLARPRVRVLARHAHHRDDAGRHRDPRRRLRGLPDCAGPGGLTGPPSTQERFSTGPPGACAPGYCGSCLTAISVSRRLRARACTRKLDAVS